MAAARRIARRLAEVRAGEDEPTPAQIQHALHDVVERCIYGVDMNDLAAELAKVSLWLEAMEPGKPLGFLDARIKIGNSLLGTTPALLSNGVPDEAFGVIEGDDKKVSAEVKKRNKVERRGQEAFSFGAPTASVAQLIDRRQKLVQPVASVEDARSRAKAYEAFDHSNEMEQKRLHADAWCAAFVWPLRAGEPEPPTSSVVRQLGDSGESAGFAETVTKIRNLTREYRFFHWHLEFPEVFGDPDAGENGAEGWPGGFSCVLGNPPWERVKLQEQEFFAARNEAVAKAPNAAARTRLIKQLAENDPILHREFLAAKRNAEGQSVSMRLSGRYPFNGRGDVNTYAVFAELFRNLTGPHGRSGIIVPTGIATDATTQYFFKDLVESSTIAALYDFENAAPIFEGVHRSFKFSLLTMAGRFSKSEVASFAFFLHDPAHIDGTKFALSPDEIKLINPNTGTLPIFRTRRDAEITLSIYRRVPVLVDETDRFGGNPWGVSFGEVIHMANDSAKFLDQPGDMTVPLYESKMAHAYNHRWQSVKGNKPDPLDRGSFATPRYWVAADFAREALTRRGWTRDWVLALRKIARASDERTLIPLVLPISGAANSMTCMFTRSDMSDLLSLVAILNSFVADYVMRQKLGGTNVSAYILNQLAVPRPEAFADSFLDPRDYVLELIWTADDMSDFATDCGDEGEPFRWDSDRRAALRVELDAHMFHLYKLSRSDVDYIMDTFPIVKRKDEAAYGEYRTKRLILEAYDAMQLALDTDVPYTSTLNPPPGQGPRHPAREVIV